MSMKKLLCAVLAGAMAMSFASVTAFAALTGGLVDSNGNAVALGAIVNSDGDAVGSDWGAPRINIGVNGSISGDTVIPGKTYYVPLSESTSDKIGTVSIADIVNEDFFKFDVDKDENGKMIKSITVAEDKKFDGRARANYLVFTLNDSTTTSDIKSTGTITFEAKDDFASYAGKKDTPVTTDPNAWQEDDTVTISYTLWINNVTPA